MGLRTRTFVIAAVSALGLAFLLGYCFPNVWWGTHYLRFLDNWQLAALLILSLVSLAIPRSWFGRITRPSPFVDWVFCFCIAAGYGILAYLNPIAHDPYGDAVYFHERYQLTSTSLDMAMNTLWSLSLDAWAGQKNVLALVELISYYSGRNFLESFRILDAACGFVFALLWARLVMSESDSTHGRIALVLVGLASPFALVFFGRTEIYAVPIVLTLCWILLLKYVLRTRSVTGLALLVLANMFCIKSHPIGVLLLPAVGLASFIILKKTSLVEIGRKKVWYFTLIPILLLGSMAYFFVFKDHVDDRAMSAVQVMQYDHLFLPIFSPAAPLDRYNVFSWNHIFDFLNVLLLISPAAILGLSGYRSGFSTSDETNNDLLTLLGITTTLFLILLFAINPLLSMPMDWDLYTLLAPLILALLAISYKEEGLNRWLLSFSILSTSFIITHLDSTKIADRLQAIGYRIYPTYYEWTATVLNNATITAARSPMEEAEMRAGQIGQIQSMKRELGRDPELSALYKELGALQLRKLKNYQDAESTLLTAKELNPATKNNRIILLECYYVQGKFRSAFDEAVGLLKFKDLQVERTLNIIVQCALEAKMYNQALYYADQGQSESLKEITRRLETNDNIEQLVNLFQRSGMSGI